VAKQQFRKSVLGSWMSFFRYGILMNEPNLNDPIYRGRLVRALLLISPFGFGLSYILAALQGAETWVALLLGAVMFFGCLGAAALFHLRGSKAGNDAVWIKVILALIGRR
jgi:hypothetical protein